LAAAIAIIVVRLALPFLTVESLRKWAGRSGHRARPIERLIWAVEVASRYIPGTKCLASALALQRLLSAHGIACQLNIGVSHHGGEFGAHAWVVHEGRILIGEEANRKYTLLTSWATDFAKSAGGRTG
jgi:hypothetical protein